MDGYGPAGSAHADCIARARGVTGDVDRWRQAHRGGARTATGYPESPHDARLFRLLLPQAIGGDELDPAGLAQVTEIIAAADASAAWCIGQAAGCAMTAAFLAPDVARRIFGPSDAVLAWGAGAQGKATVVDGGYRITGTWAFASGLHNATWLGAHCKVFEADGQPAPAGRWPAGGAYGALPREQARVHDVWSVMGLQGTGSDSYEVADFFVPDEVTLDREDLDARRQGGAVYRFPDPWSMPARLAA